MRRVSRLLALSTLAPSLAFAQVQPDAGRILEDTRRGGAVPAPARTPGLDLREPERPALSAPDSFRVLVKAFRITRNTVFGQEELAEQVAGFTNRELSIADLEQAAAVLSRYYRQRGYFVARAYVPAQDIRDGVVEITILEGRIGAIGVDVAPGSRIGEEVARGLVAGRQPPGSVIEQRGLERGLLLLNELPGVTAQSTLSPGAELGASDVRVAVSDGPLVSGSADLDTFGNRYTGVLRAGISAYLNNPSGRGDQGSVRAGGSEGLEYVRLAYSLPVGSDGLRASASMAAVRYRLCCEFAPLGAKGSAGEGALTLQYPLLRSRDANVYVSGTGTAKTLKNETAAGTTSDKRLRSLGVSLSGDLRDSWLGGGGWSASLGLTSGSLNLDGWAPDRAADAASARTHGGFSKLTYAVSRLQNLGTDLALFLSWSGQSASKNLDSSEQFSLGGPGAVRGYPVGEATGDAGTLAQAELRWQAAESTQLSAFYDRGRIRLHRDEWAGWQGANPALPNHYTLSSVGLGLSWSRPGDLALRLSIARKLGGNPGQSVLGRDSDNRNERFRFWLQVVKTF